MTKPAFIGGLHLRLVILAVELQILWIALRVFRSPGRAIRLAKKLIPAHKDKQSLAHQLRCIKFAGKYHVHYAIPGWPSQAFNRFIRNHLYKHENPAGIHIDSIVFAITNKCGFSCEHCLAWDVLNKKDELSADEVITIIQRFYQQGIAQVIFSGGEPLQRYQDLLYILKHIPADLQCWTYTNGYLMTAEKALRLREAGLCGVVFSVDHYLEAEHNRFRGREGSFERIMKGVAHCHHAGLMTCFSICVTHDTAKPATLHAYIALASLHHVPIVQLMEAKAVGHFQGKHVQLDTGEQQVLETFYRQINSSPIHAKKPIVVYPEMNKRKAGCSGNGENYLYINASGYLQSCPFCTQQHAHALTGNLTEHLRQMRAAHCNKIHNLYLQPHSY